MIFPLIKRNAQENFYYQSRWEKKINERRKYSVPYRINKTAADVQNTSERSHIKTSYMKNIRAALVICNIQEFSASTFSAHILQPDQNGYEYPYF